MQRPLANSYWLLPGRLLAGEYPLGRGRPPGAEGRAQLDALVAAGFDCFVDLTVEGECAPYAQLLPDTARHLRFGVRDRRLPDARAPMRAILDAIAAALAAGQGVYLHCRAGIGRTGTVAGCFLAEQGLDGDEALEELNRLWTSQSERALTWPVVPQTREQAEFVRAWPSLAGIADGAADAEAELGPLRALRDRYHGALLGLLLGDALAAPTQMSRPGSLAPVGDLLGGGPFDLPRGAWADEGAMALCCAASLADRDDFDAQDQLDRLRRWRNAGEYSATGQCLGITAATARALAQGPDAARAAPEVLARIAPVAMAAHGDAARTQDWAAAAVSLTCLHPRALDAGRALAAMLQAALQGEPLARVLKPAAAHFAGRPPGAATGALLDSDPRQQPLAGPGLDAVGVLALARWCLAGSRGYRDALLRAVNLGHDSDAVAATCGQLAGAHYGAAALPRGWRLALASGDEAAGLADRLLGNATVARELGAQARRA